jgi:hypothetical protein
MTDPGHATPIAPAAPDLDFDRAAPTVTSSNGALASNDEGILCSACGSTMLDEYYSVGDKPICASCRTSLETTRAKSRTPKAFGKAFGFGLGAALAGAIIYYAVIALLNLEIGIVAILIGWMVGRAIQKALPGGGSRRYQLLAALLTYFAVGVAYVPLLFKETSKDSAATQDSAVVAPQQGKPAASPPAAAKAGSDEDAHGTSGSFILGIGALIVLAFSLPVATAFSSSGGIISALIIAIGMHQAWRMVGAPTLAITGPFRVGGNAYTAGAS